MRNKVHWDLGCVDLAGSLCDLAVREGPDMTAKSVYLTGTRFNMGLVPLLDANVTFERP